MEQFIKGVGLFLRSRVILYGIIAYYTGMLYNLTGYVPMGIMSIGWFAAFLWRGIILLIRILDNEKTDRL